ncbi:di-trans,poly-cis-decaprenylcistransferase [Enterobacteriaceae endosymbiont of Plateumaris sericea]|uniref:polyprenyl diphosphate synthase n=1 Tax=Enterobacteriaceae endosymbiont of Plateumaris sericea TaxID=2675797 RepID=UPI00144A2511|nr:polyprenyl diphosphate synthase [Enterobacteriaceae endosymbiont of Plateumaris sericea]QJC29966.1 di-trans,poly-cis-decaprenylcistransferase [Enterobacteriaceae endosymbiont of Plateumaris sericea]
MIINKLGLKKLCYPNHVAIIMDGNRRWAKKRNIWKFSGHKEGVNTIKKIINSALYYKLKVLTLYAFSSENWKRSINEIKFLMNLFTTVLNYEASNLKKKNICLKIIGNISKFNINLQKSIIKAEDLTKNNNGLILNIAINYGGRWDIISGIKKIAIKIKEGLLDPKKINEYIFSKYLCLSNIIPVDLVIRTGGELRISNFLIWQIAYSELYFTDILWPDFNKKNFKDALEEFSKRKRSFGGNINNKIILK